jgi:hypothetical protein
MSVFQIRVSETGCSATGRVRDLPPGFTDLATFQAFEVWRRVAGALASIARVASWHSWVAGKEGEYAGFGLRHDGQDEGACASSSLPRPSWFAYQRLASLLGNVGVGRMLLPEVTDRGDLVRRLPTLGRAVVFEYELADPVGFRYAYLVFLDPSVGGSSPTILAPSWRAVVGRARRCTVQPSVMKVMVTGCENLPVGSATYPAPVSFPVGSPLSVHGGDMPVFIQATARIAWRVLAVAAPLESPRRWQADPMDRPEWLDDPSAPLPGKRRR